MIRPRCPLNPAHEIRGGELVSGKLFFMCTQCSTEMYISRKGVTSYYIYDMDGEVIRTWKQKGEAIQFAFPSVAREKIALSPDL